MVLLDNTVGLRSPALYTPKRSYQAHGHLWRCATKGGLPRKLGQKGGTVLIFSPEISTKFIANSSPSASIAS
jgi:hypothetical protein